MVFLTYMLFDEKNRQIYVKPIVNRPFDYGYP